MAEFPRLDFYPDAYLADTAHLSIAEAGAYTNLLWIAWRIEDGGLPTDDAVLARYARATTREWRAVKSAVLPFFTLCGDGKLRQKRLELTREAARDRSMKAGASARRRWLENNKTSHADALRTHPPSNARAMLDACSSDATTNHQPTYKIHEGKKDGLAKRNGSALRPLAEVLSGDKPQAKADADMVRHLVRKLRMDQDVASRFVRVARDPAHPEHEDCRAKCLKISRDLRLGWFA